MERESFEELLLSWSSSNQENHLERGSSAEIDSNTGVFSSTVSSLTSPRLTFSTPSPPRAPPTHDSPYRQQNFSHLSFPQDSSTSIGSFSPEAGFSSEAVGYASLPNDQQPNYSIVVEAQPVDEPPATAGPSLQLSLDQDQPKEYHVLQPRSSHPISNNVVTEPQLTSLLTTTLVDEGRSPVAKSTPRVPQIGDGSVGLHTFYESFVSSELLLAGEPSPPVVEVELSDEFAEVVGDEVEEESEEATIDAGRLEEAVEVVEVEQPRMESRGVEEVRARAAPVASAAGAGRARRDREHRVLRGRVSRAAFKCIICSKPYRQKGHLKKHLSSHAMEMVKAQGPGALIGCSVCHRTFRNRSGLSLHVRSHITESLEESD